MITKAAIELTKKGGVGLVNAGDTLPPLGHSLWLADARLVIGGGPDNHKFRSALN